MNRLLEKNVNLNKCAKNDSQRSVFGSLLYPSDVALNIKGLEVKISSLKAEIENKIKSIKYKYKFGGYYTESETFLSCCDVQELKNMLDSCQHYMKNRYGQGSDPITDFNTQQRLGAATTALEATKGAHAEIERHKSLIAKLGSAYSFYPQQFTPLHLAVYLSATHIVPIFLGKGAHIEIGDSIGATPLFWAVYRNNLELIRLLIAYNANLQALDNKGNTLLHAAAQYADLDIINYLLEMGFYYLQKNNAGQTPSEVALKYERKEISDFIVKKGEGELQAALFRIKREEQQRKDSHVISEYGNYDSSNYHQSYRSNHTQSNKPSYKTNTSLSDNLPGIDRLPILSPSAYSKVQNVSHLSSTHSSEMIKVTEQFSQLNLPYAIPYQALHFQQELGRGGFGIVYKGAYQDKLVAVKQLMNQDLSEALIHNFKQEISMMARLESPYVIKFIGACFQAPHYSLVMDYMPNGDLYHFLQKPGQIDWQLRYQIATDIGHGVNYLHSHGIIHGDLKSLNILLDKNYQAKITDFGLAKIKISSSISTLLGGQKGGSLRWMAPELLTAEEEEETSNTKASDVYSYGMVLWELGARQIPYTNKRDPQVLALKLQNKHEPITPDTPPSMSALIQWCWQERTKRPAITEAVETLEKEQRLLLNK
ncbi:MAG: ankyrin repeat-containing serine/threonine-protein kinase [Candidatus Amoebophilus sp.]